MTRTAAGSDDGEDESIVDQLQKILTELQRLVGEMDAKISEQAPRWERELTRQRKGTYRYIAKCEACGVTLFDLEGPDGEYVSIEECVDDMHRTVFNHDCLLHR